MSKTVDERVVSMQFDNRQFEKNVSTTMSTLDKLKQSLNLTGAAKGFENIDAASKKVNFSGLNGAVETVGLKFNALYSIADQALRNITNSAMNAGKRIASALTIDPIKTGFQEYETQINAVQTILANTESKGTTLQDVNRALDELNTYADKTIYNFTEMTRNIGTFTAAGVDLDTSVSAIQGIANLAAVSGSTSQQASTAMYQLSQALAAGRVTLMDWNSVVNAGMGGQVFQDALKQTAENMGTDVDAIIKKYGSFRESLSKGEWLTTDVLTKTLEQFTMAAEEGTEQWETYKKSLMDDGYSEEQALSILKMANTATDAATKVKTFTQLCDTLKESVQSGWTQSWEIILGDFGEAKEFFTEISNRLGEMIGASADARNEMLSGGLSSGWKQLLNEGIADEEGYKETIKSVAKEHGVSIDKMIAAEKKRDESLTDGEAFQKALKKGLDEGKISSDMLSESVHKMADEMSNMSAEELEAAGYTKEHIEQIKELSSGLKDGSISMDEFVKKITRASGRENIIQALWNAFDGLMSVVIPVKEAFREIFPPITGEQLYSFTETLVKLTEKLTVSETTAENIKRTFKGVFAIFSIGVKAIKALFGGFADLIGYIAPAGDGLLGFTANIGDFLVSLNEAIGSSNIFNKAIKKIGDFLKPIADGVKSFASAIKNAFTDIADTAEVRFEPLTALGKFIQGVFKGLGAIVAKVAPSISKLASGVGQAISNMMSGISSSVANTDYSTLFDFLNGGIFAAIGVFVARFVKSAGDILDDAGGFLDGIKDILDGVSDALGAFTESLKAKTLKDIAIAIGILAASLLVLSFIDSEKLTGSLAAITVLFAELFAGLSIFSKIAGEGLKGVAKTSAALISMSAALLVLSVAMKILSTMSWSEMGVGLISITVGIGALVAAVNLLPESKVNNAAKAIKKLSSSLLIFSVAMKILGSMSWEEMGVGLVSMTIGLGTMVGALHLLPKDIGLKATGMIALASAMVILGTALKIMGSMSWEEVGKSLTALAGSLIILAGAMTIIKKAIPGALALTIIAPALIALSGALKIMGSMSWSEIARGLIVLGGSLVIIAGALTLMKGALPGALALVVISASLSILAPVLKILGSMSWGEIARGLITLAGAFTIIGVAGLVLKPLVPTILSLSGAIALFGIGCAAVGAGVLMLGAGITALAVALAASGGAITIFVSSLIGLIPYLIEQIGVGIIKLCEVISGSAAAICEAATVIILALVDALVAAVPAIAEGALILISSLLDSLVQYTPKIVNSLFDFVIGLIDELAKRLPDLIKAGVNLLMSLFQGIIDALNSVDPGILVNGILAVGLLSALMISLAAMATLTPAAMVGVLGLGTVIAELSIVLAAIGALAQIPGLEWLISEGGNLMQSIGTAIGQFLGGIVGGFAQGMSSVLPQIGSDLSTFIINAMPFITGVKLIDSSVIEGVKTLVGVVLAITAADVIEGLTSWFTGGSSLVQFGKEIAEFAPYIRQYADTVKGLDTSAVLASATAAQCLSQLASNLPNSGGFAGWFAGENDIGSFGAQLVPFGEGMKAYSDAIVGFNGEAVIASANAAKALTDMASTIPNQGGMVSWFTGENSVASFGFELVALGTCLKSYSESIAGFDEEAVIASANAAKALADMTSNIPNQGGMVAWFTGENSVARFANELVTLGYGLKSYSESIAGFNPEAAIASAGAAKAIADMTSYIPNQGGMVAWFTGDNSIARFSSDLVSLGFGLKSFSVSVAGIIPENIVAAANAAKSIAEMANVIPNQGGMVAWFTGENSLSRFAYQLPLLGSGLLAFSTSITGIIPENIVAAANAAKSIAEMASIIPNEGGLTAWFKGENSIASFASQLPMLGFGLFRFSVSVAGIIPENIVAAANAAKSLVDLTSVIPSEGGVKAWFSGETSIANFASQLPILGLGLLGFSTSVAGIVPENITAAAGAAKSLAEMANVIPKEGGVKAWFSGETSIANFANKLPTLGEGLSGFSKAVVGIEPTSVTAAANAAKSLAEMTETVPKETTKLITFGTNLVTFGDKLSSYFTKTAGVTSETISNTTKAVNSIKNISSNINPESVKSASTAITDMVNAMKNLSKIKGNTTDGFISSINKIGEANISAMTKSLKSGESKLKDAGKKLIENFVDGVESQKTNANKAGKTILEKFIDGIDKQKSKATNACKKVVTDCVDAINNKSSSFSTAGKNLVKGFASGISSNTWIAEAKAKAMAEAATKAAKKALDINSPSKVFRKIGMSVPEGFAQGIERLGGMVTSSSQSMGNIAINGVKKSIARVAEATNTDMDTQPTIRPVLDLSDVSAGVGAMNGMFNSPSLGVMSNIRAINSMMNENQNGGNSDIVTAINKLRKDLGNVGNTSYNINGVTYDDGSNISDAVKTIVRAARMERRV